METPTSLWKLLPSFKNEGEKVGGVIHSDLIPPHFLRQRPTKHQRAGKDATVAGEEKENPKDNR